MPRPYHGLFVGMTTLDLIYRVAHPPEQNQKLVASDYTVSAGGPATNAAVAFCALGNRATLLSVVGQHAMTQLVRADLQGCGVTISDLDPTRSDPPVVSSILITEATGERAVVSINAANMQVPEERIPASCLEDVDIVLIDGHQMQVGRAIAYSANARKIPVVVDGGSWKPGFETVLALTDYAICSANFHPPGCQTDAEIAAYLLQQGVSHVAITQGEQPILYWNADQAGQIEPPSIDAVDTVGAGDIFHGAFCDAILQGTFTDALTIAATVAAHSCRFFGTRRWMEGIGDREQGVVGY